MKAICWGVTDSAAMIRSASFSREGSSRTTTNSPLPEGRKGLVRVGREAAGDCVWAGLTEGLDCVGDAVELGGVHLVGGRHGCGLVVEFESLCARSAWEMGNVGGVGSEGRKKSWDGLKSPIERKVLTEQITQLSDVRSVCIVEYLRAIRLEGIGGR
jgi:hypothetical protein